MKVWRIFTGATCVETMPGKPPRFCWLEEACLDVPDLPKKHVSGFEVDMGPAGFGFIPFNKVDAIAVQEEEETEVPNPGPGLVLRRTQ